MTVGLGFVSVLYRVSFGFGHVRMYACHFVHVRMYENTLACRHDMHPPLSSSPVGAETLLAAEHTAT